MTRALHDHQYPRWLYALNTQAPGFQKYDSNDNKLDPSGHLTINVPLVVGAATETVQVTANVATLQTESAFGAAAGYAPANRFSGVERPESSRTGGTGTRRSVRPCQPDLQFQSGPGQFQRIAQPENLITFDGAPLRGRAPMAPAGGR